MSTPGYEGWAKRNLIKATYMMYKISHPALAHKAPPCGFEMTKLV
jgi:hypothetical protein